MSACHCRICGEGSRVVTVTLYGSDDRAYVVTADVSGRDVSLWTGPEDLDIAALSSALGMSERDVKLSIAEAA